jgi:hypothetical protein
MVPAWDRPAAALAHSLCARLVRRVDGRLLAALGLDLFALSNAG